MGLWVVEVGVVVIPNPCRHPAYHILPNTPLVYQFMYIKNVQEHQFHYILCIYKVNGGGVIVKIPRPSGPITGQIFLGKLTIQALARALDWMCEFYMLNLHSNLQICGMITTS